MLKRFLLISLLLTSCAYADLFHGEGYVSPEHYAVNEADMINDYSYIPPAPRLNIDNLDDMRFNAPEIVEKEIPIGSEETPAKKKGKKAKVHHFFGFIYTKDCFWNAFCKTHFSFYLFTMTLQASVWLSK